MSTEFLVLLLLAFSGGVFGASIGALPSFTVCGFMVIAGELIRITQINLGLSEIFPVYDVTMDLAFGTFIGPHVAFGGGAAALAYKSASENIFPEFHYHPAKDVTTGLGNRSDVLLIGGIFGILGFLVATGSRLMKLPWDPIAFGVVMSAILHRLAFGYHVLGDYTGNVFDMSREDPGESSLRFSPPEPWLPYQLNWFDVSLLGGAMGALGGFTAYVTGSAFFAFGISVATLVFLNAGVERIPVTHHMTLPASTAPLAFYGAESGLVSVTWTNERELLYFVLLGIVFGWLGAILGEVLQRLLYAYSETHLDPPAASIVVSSLIIAILFGVDLFPEPAWVPFPFS